MTSYNFGDVVLVPFPFTDQTTNKKRPAVVISSDVYNAEYPDRLSELLERPIASETQPIIIAKIKLNCSLSIIRL
jgi:PemK-like, MazF-like toxin of type II toxin-antitoxin system